MKNYSHCQISKYWKNQLESTMKSIQTQSTELVVNTPQGESSKDYWLRRLKQAIELLQDKIVKEESK
jgi:hypothetical protein